MAIIEKIGIQRVTTSDVEEMNSLVCSWDQSYTQIEGGRFNGRIDLLRFPDSTNWMRKSSNRALRKNFCIPKDDVCFVFVLSKSDPLRFEGMDLDPGDAFFLPGDCWVDFVCKGSFEGFAIYGPRKVFYDSEGENYEAITRQPTIFKSIHASKFAHMIAEAIHSGVDVLDVYGGNYLNERLKYACRSFANERSRILVSRPRALEIVDAANKYLLEAEPSVDQNMLVADIASSLGVSVRTLEYSFRHHLGISPLRFMTLARLHAARRDLRSHRNKMSVTDVAMKWGFWHLGRFASTYQAVFDELPSITLRSRAGQLN